MDRKNYHLESPDCRTAARDFLPYVGEDFLVTLANKGLYKRALKDFEALAEYGLRSVADGLVVDLDGVTVTLRRDVAKSTCTCPSKTVCKHILMALLGASAVAGEEGTEATPSEAPAETVPSDVPTESAKTALPEPFEALNRADLTLLRRKAGKRLFDDALRLVQEGWTAEITRGEMISAVIPTESCTVFFPPEDSIERAVCKCGASGLCRHKLIGVLSWLRLGGLLEKADGEEQSLLALDKTILELLQAADEFVCGVLDKGVISCGESDAEAAVQFSIKLDTQGIGNLSRLFRSLGTDFENLVDKNAAFSQTMTFGTLARLHNTLGLILRHPEDGQLFGALVERSRSDYYSTPLGRFVGLGVYPWRTRSGYSGCTAFLYHLEKGCICTYGMSMANYYENSQADRMLEIDDGVHWQEGLSMRTIASGKLKLQSFKTNRLNRLSSGKLTSAEISGKTDFAAVGELPIAVSPGQVPELREEPYSYFGKKQPDTVIALRATALAEVYFDRAAQKLSFLFQDESGERVPGELLYSKENARAIRRIESLGAHSPFEEQYFICLRRRGRLIPVSIVTKKGVDHFYFEERWDRP